MDQENAAKLAKILFDLHDVFWIEDVVASQPQYERGLEGCDMDVMVQAVDLILREEKRFPTPATMREYYARIRGAEPVKVLSEPELTPDQLRRSRIMRFLCLRWWDHPDSKERKKRLVRIKDRAFIEDFVKRHWETDFETWTKQIVRLQRRAMSTQDFEDLNQIWRRVD